jgi:hypothetical protein
VEAKTSYPFGLNQQKVIEVLLDLADRAKRGDVVFSACVQETRATPDSFGVRGFRVEFTERGLHPGEWITPPGIAAKLDAFLGDPGAWRVTPDLKPLRCRLGFHDWRRRGGRYVDGHVQDRIEQCRRCDETRWGWTYDPKIDAPHPLPWSDGE